MAEVLLTIRCRVLRLLARRGVIAIRDHVELLASDAAEHDPVLAQLTAAAVCGQAPAGPERRLRSPLRLAPGKGATMTGPLCATDGGFSLHAATVAAGDDPRGKERLLKYVLRPPLSQQRLELLDDGLVRINLKRPFSDGTIAIDLDPVSLLCRLAAAVPAPHFNTVRYAGVLAPAARWRPLVVPPPRPAEAEAEPEADGDGSREQAAGHERPRRRSGWRPWLELLKRSFDIDLRCPSCDGVMKLKSFLTSPRSLRRLLTKLDVPAELQGKAPARAPPYFASKVVRRHFGEPDPQLAMFH